MRNASLAERQSCLDTVVTCLHKIVLGVLPSKRVLDDVLARSGQGRHVVQSKKLRVFFELELGLSKQVSILLAARPLVPVESPRH